MAETYFVRFRGRTVGPYSLAQAQQMARKGQLSRASEVSNDGQAWSQAGSFPEIFERPAGNALTPGKSSSLSIDTDLSPGGSVTASDQILHAVMGAQKAGKPVVVSMGGVVASGGYFISTTANHGVISSSAD